ncbi:Protein GLUTAMINE DUMPER 1 [Striga hermonthica]|uniref:Protein GLUTAMINE DUMPER 1 n=1 Tax=Striga hermonthica TaxID=68872 RepID=A0A9N7NP15_STRHE|nr:Protein GLUTAMINE DUMPER 1 [Striga hermonthica]
MRPAPQSPNSAAAKTASSWRWDSPLPYLFAGLGLMLLLIAAALVVLACSYRKRRSPAADYGGEKPVRPSTAAASGEDSPRIVVIMAGEGNPTHLAIPIVKV